MGHVCPCVFGEPQFPNLALIPMVAIRETNMKFGHKEHKGHKEKPPIAVKDNSLVDHSPSSSRRPEAWGVSWQWRQRAS